MNSWCRPRSVFGEAEGRGLWDCPKNSPTLLIAISGERFVFGSESFYPHDQIFPLILHPHSHARCFARLRQGNDLDRREQFQLERRRQNWSNGLPIDGDDVVLTGMGFDPTNLDIVGLDLNTLTFNLDNESQLSGGYTVGGNDFTIGAGGIQTLGVTGTEPAGASAITFGLTNNVEVVGDGVWSIERATATSVNLNITVDMSGIVSGSNQVRVNSNNPPSGFGGGTLSWSNTANTFSGTLILDTFNKTQPIASIGASPTNPIRLAENNSNFGYTGPTATIQRDFEWADNNNGINNNGSGTLTVDGDVRGFSNNAFRTQAFTNDIVITGEISNTGSGGFSARGTNTTTLEGASTYEGNTAAGHTGNNNGTTLALGTGFSSVNTRGFVTGQNATLDASAVDGGAGLELVTTTVNPESQFIGGRGTVTGTIITSSNQNQIIPSTVEDVTRALQVVQKTDPTADWGQTLTMENLDTTLGASFQFDLGGANQSQLEITGLLTGSTNSGDLLFDFYNTSGILENDTFELIVLNGGSFSGVDVSDFAAASGVPAGLQSIFSIDADSVDVTFTLIPEPSTAFLLALGIPVLLRRRMSASRANVQA